MTQVPKQTALFFGFLAAAMTQASAQAAPLDGQGRAPTEMQRSVERGETPVVLDRASRAAAATPAPRSPRKAS